MKKDFTTNIFLTIGLSGMLLMSACGSEVKDVVPSKETATVLELNEYGIEGSIEMSAGQIKVIDAEAKYEQRILPNKRIEIDTEENFMLVISECQENGVDMKVEFAEGFGENVLEKGDDFCIIEQEDQDGNLVYDVSLFVEKDGAFLEFKVCDPESKAQVSQLEIAKKGLAKAKTFKFS